MLKNKGLLILLVIITFYILFSIYSGVNQLVKNLENLKLYLIIPILVSFTVGIFIKSIRQNFLLNHIGIKVPFKENLLIYLGGLSMLITPGGIGELIKSHFLKRNHGESVSKTSPIVLAERYHDVLAIFSILLLFYAVSKVGLLTIPIFVIGVFLLSTILIIKNNRAFRSILDKFTKIKFLKIVEKNSKEFNDSLFSLCNNKIMLKTWITSVIAWSFDAFAMFLCFKALNLNFNYISTTTLSFSSILFGAFSFLPAGIGVTEFSFVKLLSLNGLTISMGTTLILLIRLLGDFYSTSIGIMATKYLLSRKF